MVLTGPEPFILGLQALAASLSSKKADSGPWIDILTSRDPEHLNKGESALPSQQKALQHLLFSSEDIRLFVSSFFVSVISHMYCNGSYWVVAALSGQSRSYETLHVPQMQFSVIICWF